MNKAVITDAIINFWRNYLGFTQIPSTWEIGIIIHKSGSEIPDDDLIVFNYLSKGQIVSVAQQYFDEIEYYIQENWVAIEDLQKKFELTTQKKTQVYGPVISFYLFSTDKLLPINSSIEKLEITDKKIFDDFIGSCVDGEMQEVDMDFMSPHHHFFILRHEWEVVSLGNYSLDETGKTPIAHIWIVTPKRHAWKGFGKELVSAMTHNILNKELVPQYRAKSSNAASLKIAESLWFTPVIESLTISSN